MWETEGGEIFEQRHEKISAVFGDDTDEDTDMTLSSNAKRERSYVRDIRGWNSRNGSGAS